MPHRLPPLAAKRKSVATLFCKQRYVGMSVYENLASQRQAQSPGREIIQAPASDYGVSQALRSIYDENLTLPDDWTLLLGRLDELG